MSTRATYQIKTEYDGTHTFYIHHDGYPEYSFEYFKAMLAEHKEKEAPNATLADAFHRGNPRSELTPNHETHGDTEYRYTLEPVDARNGTVEGAMLRCLRGYGDSWKSFFYGPVSDFIDKYDKP